MELLAEGVETNEQALLLQEMGCDKAQGYLYSKPVPPDRIPQLLASGAAS
jgi:EAL domain-containing protein (putative c-di-GMP-specific phosphodiesterase class I)